MRFLRNCDFLWLGLNGLIIDVAHVTSGAKARTPLSTIGTLKVEPSLIPGVDFLLNKVMKKHGGWNYVMTADFAPSEAFYKELAAAGLDRERFDRSRLCDKSDDIYS